MALIFPTTHTRCIRLTTTPLHQKGKVQCYLPSQISLPASVCLRRSTTAKRMPPTKLKRLLPIHAADDRTRVESVPAETKDEGWRKTALLGVLFAGWYLANIWFNIYNKSALQLYPCPVICTCIQFGVGSLMVIFGWLTNLIKRPEINLATCTAVLPLAVVHTLGNSFTNLSLGRVAVTFTHTIKAMEPFFSVVLSSLFLGERPTLLIVLSLLPIVGGVAAASLSEASFNWPGFLSAMGSNLTFQSRNVLSKKTMGSSKLQLDNISLFSLITIASFFLILPFAFVAEGHLCSIYQMHAYGVREPMEVFKLAALAGVYFHTYQQVSYMILQRVSPVTHSIGNCIKRVIVIIAAGIFFRNSMSLQNKIGTSIALLGVFMYSQAKRKAKKKAK